VGTVSDIDYQGSSSNTLAIGKATPAITWAAPAADSVWDTAERDPAQRQLDGRWDVRLHSGSRSGPRRRTADTLGHFYAHDSADYTAATVYITLVVNKGAPAITWAAPAGIPYGTALSATQLNANTTVLEPTSTRRPAGTVLSAGPQTLSVSLYADDSTDYNTATSTVQLTVNKATPAITWATPAAVPTARR